jgi:ABC-type branched-subunit amino acid transport system ATPase component
MRKAVKRLNVGYKSLKLRNFTCFKNASFDFVPGINVLAGENGTGKTHVMKVLYSWLLSQSVTETGLVRTLETVMESKQGAESNLVRHGTRDGKALLEGTYGERSWNEVLVTQKPGMFARGHVTSIERPERPVFIPSTDMIGHLKGFTNLWDEFSLDFDYTYRDICHLLGIQKDAPSPQYHDILRQLEQDVLKGKVEYDRSQERFFLVRGEQRQPMALVAEGLRKIATLLVLVRNGSIKHGTTLFWDEPEVNLNPSLMDEVAKALWVLVNNGVQVFVASHSYLILREIEVQAQTGDNLRYFALEKLESEVKVHPTSNYLGLKPNLIEDQYGSLYDRSIEKRIAEVENAEPRLD